MPKQHNIMIHEFVSSENPQYDDEGDQLLGFYYQLTDVNNMPVSALIGPYRLSSTVERAAIKAFNTGDF